MFYPPNSKEKSLTASAKFSTYTRKPHPHRVWLSCVPLTRDCIFATGDDREREGGMERIGKGGIYDKIKVTFRGNFESRNQNNDN
jgi:hypothetical protein